MTEKPTFTPGPHWEDVPEGAILPPGAHYTIDINTGRKRARMPAEDEGEAGPYDAQYEAQGATNGQQPRGNAADPGAANSAPKSRAASST